MQLYLLTGLSDSLVQRYCATQAEAQERLRSHLKIHPQDAFEARVELIEVSTDKDALLGMLNQTGGFQVGDAKRCWRTGPRGGLVECTGEE